MNRRKFILLVGLIVVAFVIVIPKVEATGMPFRNTVEPHDNILFGTINEQFTRTDYDRIGNITLNATAYGIYINSIQENPAGIYGFWIELQIGDYAVMYHYIRINCEQYIYLTVPIAGIYVIRAHMTNPETEMRFNLSVIIPEEPPYLWKYKNITIIEYVNVTKTVIVVENVTIVETETIIIMKSIFQDPFFWGPLIGVEIAFVILVVLKYKTKLGKKKNSISSKQLLNEIFK